MSISFKRNADGEFVKTVSRRKARTPQEIAREEIMEKVKTFTADQLRAFNMLIDNNNPFVYLGGSAGTGKSYTLTTAIDFMRRVENEWVAVTATTATAALLIEAQTVHKFFGFAPDVLIDEKGKAISHATKKLCKCSVIVIDEVSMLRCDTFSSVISSVRKINRKRAKEGLKPCRLLMCGDPCQLPSILSDIDKSEIEARLEIRLKKKYDIGEGWFFNSPDWNFDEWKCIELTEIMRQKGNTELIENLNRIRLGDGSHSNWFNHNCNLVRFAPPDVVRLFPYNKQVRAYNNKRLSEMEGTEVSYTAELNGVTAEEVEDCGYDYELKLKPNALVMLKCNPYSGCTDWVEMLCQGIDSADYIDYFCNGTTGIYRGTMTDAKGEYLYIEIPDKETGKTHDIKLRKKVFDIYDYVEVNDRWKKVKSGRYFMQYPCVLAMAISIHKSQGASLPAVAIEPLSFASGQLYVALSRVKGDASNIYLVDMIRPEYAILSDEVKGFLKRIKEKEEENLFEVLED